MREAEFRKRDDVHFGNSFNVALVARDWIIYRYSDEGSHEAIVLDRDAMDELRDYFAKHYEEDKALPSF